MVGWMRLCRSTLPLPRAPSKKELPSKLKAVDELAGLDAETVGQVQHRRQPRLATAALQAADARRLDA